MKNNIDVKSAFFFASLIIIPVVLTFNFMFYYAFFSVVASILFYQYSSVARVIRLNVAGTKFFYFFVGGLGLLLGVVSFAFDSLKEFLFLIWIALYFYYAMDHGGRFQKFIDRNGADD